ncbi:MAG TPA: metallopeptidase TldD-related protein [Anaeromyxobacteraceae bacterium]|nr:metallopeptidase TldD-related protein [Anaeromyxobacteraceae bacterium]
MQLPTEHRGRPGPTDQIGYFAAFAVTEKLIAEALAAALSRGGDYADVFFQHRIASSLGLEDGAVNRAYGSARLGAGIRVVKGDQTGYGFTEDLTAGALRECARTAAAIADGPGRDAPERFHVEERLPQRYPVRLGWDEVRPEQKLPLLARLNERAFASDPRVRKVNVHFADESSAILLADSQGRLVEDLQPMTLLAVSVVLEDGRRRESNGYNVAGRAGFEFYTQDRLDRVVREAVARTLVLFDAVPAPAGEMPVVLAAGSSGILLHEAIGHGMEADFNRKKVSIYADKVGQAIARPFVNIVDDATPPGARGAINVDDEGNPAGRTHLVENGVLATFLHDSISARHYGVAPTGNGRRESYQYPPLPRMRATYMLPGPHRREEILASVKRGLYCESFANGQVQIGAGDFTFYVKNAWLVEEGRLTRPVKDVNLIGNGPKVLERIDMVADDLALDEGGWTCGKNGQSVPVSQGLPTVRVASMTVGGRGGRTPGTGA